MKLSQQSRSSSSPIPARYRFVRSGETLLGCDRTYHVTRSGIEWRSIPRNIVGDVYDRAWLDHPAFIIRPESVSDLRLSDYYRRLADFIDFGPPVDPRDQSLLDRWSELAWRLGVRRRELFAA